MDYPSDELFPRSDPQPVQMPDAEVLLWTAVDLGDEPTALRDALIEQTPWRQDRIKLFGKVHDQPRLTAWYGDPGTAYTYSGLTLEPLPWTPLLTSLRARVEALSQVTFNSVLLNYYRDNRDAMGMHADDEPELGERPVDLVQYRPHALLFLPRWWRDPMDKGYKSRDLKQIVVSSIGHFFGEVGGI